jgi:DNA-directed RNA polymerase specialized sigma54-like protein
MSLKLTTSLSQRLVLTPQLRQRIEMLQMTTLELTDLIQAQLLENPVLEEVATQEEAQELAEKILDHLTGADPGAVPEQSVEAVEPDSEVHRPTVRAIPDLYPSLPGKLKAKLRNPRVRNRVKN